MKTVLFMPIFVLVAGLAATTPAADLSNSVAVLDVTVENPAEVADDWTVGLADFVELALQKEGIPTLERRQIRLILAERDLQAHGFLEANMLRAARLPTVAYFIGGNLSRGNSNEFALTFSVNRAEAATVEATVTRRGVYPGDWLPAIAALAKEMGARLQIAKREPSARSEFETLTWLPEASLPFFKGLEYYAHGNFALAVPWFRHAFDNDKHFDQAHRWEARAYAQLGLPGLAEAALRQVEKRHGLRETTGVMKRPVVAVVAADAVAAAGRAAFVDALVRSGRFELFESASIGATTHEIDLQLTGRMAAPLNERSVWLVVDSVVFLDLPGDGSLRALQQNLLSEEILRQATVASPDAPGDASYAALAKTFLQSELKPQARAPTEKEGSPRDVSEPDSQDKAELSFAKALRVVQAKPNCARYWVGLSDYYWNGWTGDWALRTRVLDHAIAAIEREREQADAAFWLTSALWRKREMSRRVYGIPNAPAYTERPLTNDFAKLLEWFPASQEARTLEEVSNRVGIFDFSAPKDTRYLAAVFTNNASRPRQPEVKVAPVPVATVTDAQRLARLMEYRREGKNALAWRVAYSLHTAKDPAVQSDVQQAYHELLQIHGQEKKDFAAFVAALESKQSQSALESGQKLLNCILRKQRVIVIQKCGELIKEAKGFPAQVDFVVAQADRYTADFDVDPISGAPVTEIVDFRLEPVAAVGPECTTSGMDYTYPCMMGELAERARAQKRPDLSAMVFDAMHKNQALPLRNRLTAAYDLAASEYEQGRDFEAIELLNEVLRQTEGTGMPQARESSCGWSPIEAAAFDLLRKIRLYSGANGSVCDCCGEIPQAPLPKPENFAETDRFLEELSSQTKGGVGGNNSRVTRQLVERKGEVLPVMLYRLRNDRNVAPILSLCGMMGTNAAVALPYIMQYVCHKNRLEDYNNALFALGGMGQQAACAKPVLILATEDSESVFNAKWALHAVGPAPLRVMPYLAQLLYHKSSVVCEKAAQAMIETANLDKSRFDGKSGAPLILLLRQWWEEDGIKRDWSKTETHD